MRNFEKKHNFLFFFCSKRTFNAAIALEMILDDDNIPSGSEDEQLSDDDGSDTASADESSSNEGGYDTDLESNDTDITYDTTSDSDCTIIQTSNSDSDSDSSR